VPGISGNEGIFSNSVLSGGTIISGANVAHSVLAQNIFIDDGSMIENCVVFDNVKICKHTRLNKCIIDKNVTIADGDVTGYDQNKDKQRFTVTDSGIVVIASDYHFHRH